MKCSVVEVILATGYGKERPKRRQLRENYGERLRDSVATTRKGEGVKRHATKKPDYYSATELHFFLI